MSFLSFGHWLDTTDALDELKARLSESPEAAALLAALAPIETALTTYERSLDH